MSVIVIWFSFWCLWPMYEVVPFLIIPRAVRLTPTVGTVLFGGRGVATSYRWKEEAFEIDVTVQVPKETRAKDIIFRPTVNSIDLRLKGDDAPVLLDGSRTLRGRVNLDGTYWVISDSEEKDDAFREVTVTIEKLIRTPQDDFEVVEYDWKGVYANDTEEVLERTYDEPEELNVREYAASLGVDIDNINMSMVDKTMFSSGMNITKNSLDELNKAGLIKEITQQADGTEYDIDDEGNAVKFSMFGDSNDDDETDSFTQSAPTPIPFLDTDSPWHSAVRVDDITNQTYVKQTRQFTRSAFAQDSVKDPDDVKTNMADARDPIDNLTVKRLKEILKSQGLKVNGTKKELQDRLRQQVNSLLQGKQENE
ncbi:hypothetical protein FisN_1Lh452 [Fistulifera solaris]|uniref:SAP domain-containing protein n=1 Tax=Fistulifera solaris TaxID=1519565 RepID=A0A1Z5K1R3_FISSO|nr:hypothetical protein FisN_1Lh452 [Fistulifera solaris]|eukprot:GAX20066.1 hypothetical protein FisN_1Lh452 [Fistulifera solaris]